MTQPQQCALVKQVTSTFEKTVQLTRSALEDQGFGVLTEIDVTTTLKKKLGIDYPKTVVLGACNPSLAHRALVADPNISTLLPCNVVVRETQKGSVEVAAINPKVQLALVAHPDITAIAAEVDKRVRAVLAAIG